MDLLITNDDAIHAEGLLALEKAAGLAWPGAQIYVVAPETEQSMCGHRVTTREPLVVKACGERRWTVAGTPADCVRVALFGLKLKPKWVLSGINHGGNMGQDAFISGTVAGVREAAYHGVPGIALSHYIIGGLAFDWQRMERWAGEVIGRLSQQKLQRSEFFNVNFPHLPAGPTELPEVVHCKPAVSPLNVSYQLTDGGYVYNASYAERPRDVGSDVEAAFSGKVAVTRLMAV
jgi:5'-nucleotidase